MKILHFADTHCRDKDIEEIAVCLKEILRIAQVEQPDLIVMAGDTFDSRMIRLDSLAAKLIFQSYSDLADRAPMIVITGTPSHDGMTVQVLEHIRGRYEVYVSDYPEQILLDHNGHFIPNLTGESSYKALISTIPTPTKQFWQQYGELSSIKETDNDIAAAMGVMLANFGAEAAKHDFPHILVGHFQVGGAFVSETQQLTGVDIELSRDQIGLAEADLVCLGHIHLSQKIGDNIFYSGSIYRKDFGELEEKGFYIHELEGKALIDSRFMKTPTRKLVKLWADLTNGHKSIQDVIAGNGDVAGAFVRFEIKVWQDEADALDLQAINEALALAENVELKIQRVPRETVRAAKLLELSKLRDKVREMALLRKEDVPESILAKADMLEHLESDELCKAVGNA